MTTGPHYDHNIFKDKTSFLRWFFGWLPEKWLKKIGPEVVDEDDEDEEMDEMMDGQKDDD